MTLEDVKQAFDWLEKKLTALIRGGLEQHRYRVRLVATFAGASVTHLAVVFIGLWSERAWSTLVAKALEWPSEGMLGLFAIILFWALVLATMKGGHFMRCFMRGLTFPIYVYYFLSIAV